MAYKKGDSKNVFISTLKNSVLVVAGTFVLAFGTSVFIIPFNLVTGGVSGMGIILHRILSVVPFFASLRVELYASVINWILFFVGFVCLGKSFALKTLVSTVTYPFALSAFGGLVSSGAFNGFFDLLSERYSSMPELCMVLATIFGGAAIGAGCALTFLGGGSTGGTDIIAFIICKFFTRLKSSTVIFACDALIVLLGMFVINNLVVSLLGIVSALVCAVAIDKVFLGESGAFIAQIISEKHEQINEAVIDRMQRTTTVTDVIGGYSGKQRKMVMVTFSMRQYAEFTAILSSIDKNAFVTIHRAHEINGEGWTLPDGHNLHRDLPKEENSSFGQK